MSFLLLLCLLFNKIGEKGRTDALEARGVGEREGMKGRGERCPNQCMHI
jgi:hypothetical protein